MTFFLEIYCLIPSFLSLLCFSFFLSFSQRTHVWVTIYVHMHINEKPVELLMQSVEWFVVRSDRPRPMGPKVEGP